MNQKKAKRLRKQMFKAGIAISSEPYTVVVMGHDSIGRAKYQVFASDGRRMY